MGAEPERKDPNAGPKGIASRAPAQNVLSYVAGNITVCGSRAIAMPAGKSIACNLL